MHEVMTGYIIIYIHAAVNLAVWQSNRSINGYMGDIII